MSEPMMKDITLRQWYAGQALAGILANSKITEMGGDGILQMANADWTCPSEDAFHMADMMLKYEEYEARQREEARARIRERQKNKGAKP